MKSLKYSIFMLAIVMIIASCGSDPDPLTISSITATGTSFEDGASVTSDLNGASAAEDVALDAVITVTFDRDIDLNSVSGTSVSISNASGSVAGTVTPSGNMLTIDPEVDFDRGTAYTLSIMGINAADEGSLANVSRTFTTEGKAPVVVPNAANQIAYWSFDGSADDLTGDFPASDVISVSYGTDRFGQGGSTATFDGDESVIVIPGGDRLLADNDFALSLWVKTNSIDHVNQDGNPTGFFVLGLAAFKGIQLEINGEFNNFKFGQGYELPDGTFTNEDAFFAGNGMFADNGGWQGWDFQADLTATGGVEALIKDKWTHILVSYNSATKHNRIYVNGDLMKGHDFNLWPDGSAKRDIVGVGYGGVAPSELPELAFGFVHSPDGELWDDTPWGDYDKPTSNHFKGDLDDVRFFNTFFTPDQAKALYDAEKN